MTDFDELLSRLRRLEPIPLDRGLEASVRRQGRRRVRAGRRTPVASLAVAATVIVYLGWALHFTSTLYR